MRAFVNARVYAFDPQTRSYARRDDGFVVDGSAIVSLDAARSVGAGIETVDLDGATVLPAFADCHVHLTDTGYFLGARDLAPVRSYAEYVERVAALPLEPFVLAGNYDESDWVDGRGADAVPLERALADRLVLLSRVDGHSCIVNRNTLAFLALDPQTTGIERGPDGTPTGKLFLDANWRAQARFMAAIPLAQRRAAERRALELALSGGALHLHAQLLGFPDRAAYADEVTALRRLGPAKWYPKICERDPELAASLGLPFVGGDVFLDGSIGSGTAAVGTPYCDRPGSGRLMLRDDEVRAYFSRAEELGVSAGVHAIGDRAIEQCIAAWEAVLNGRPSPRGARHFIEHFEIARADQIARCARLGLFLSMQPTFDATWGGSDGMYAVRLGPERARAMNRLASAVRAGIPVCGGDDSPVCRLSPLLGMQAAVDHHTPEERLSPPEALTMYTYDAARLAHAENRTGALAVGYAADFVVLDRDPIVDGTFRAARVLETWADGRRVWSRTEPGTDR